MRHVLIPLIVIGALFTGGCERTDSAGSSTQPSAGGDGERITVAMLPKKKGIPYFSTCADGAQIAAKELGVELIFDGPTDGSPEKAAGMIEKWALQGVDVIAVSPNDPKVLARAMKEAQDKGVKVITWDSDGEPGTRSFFVNQATGQEIGYQLADTLAADIASAAGVKDPKQAEGKVAIITATLTAANQNEWMEHIKARIAAEYPKLNLIAVQPSNEDQKLAFQIAQDLMKANPDLKGIWAISSNAFPGAAEAIKQAGKAGQVQITGLSTPNDMKSFVLDGTVKSVILWNTNDLGYLTVQVAKAVADGTLKDGATRFAAGKLGEKEVRGDNVLLGKILVFTRENIEQFNF